MRRSFHSAAFLTLIAATAFAAEPVRVLFIGNSLTFTNNLPAMVESIAKENGARLTTRTIALPNYSLEDHWNQGDARRAIAETRWSFVVLQQGPSALPESRTLLVEYARRFASEAKHAGARTALFMVWPSFSRVFDFDGVRFSYQTAALEVGGIFLPAGEAWREAWNRDAKLPLYGPDEFHPSRLGSYLAALVIFQGLTGKAPGRSTRPFAGADAQLLLDAVARALGAAAAKTVAP